MSFQRPSHNTNIGAGFISCNHQQMVYYFNTAYPSGKMACGKCNQIVNHGYHCQKCNWYYECNLCYKDPNEKLNIPYVSITKRPHDHPLRFCSSSPYKTSASCGVCSTSVSQPYHCDTCVTFDMCEKCFKSTGSKLAGTVTTTTTTTTTSITISTTAGSLPTADTAAAFPVGFPNVACPTVAVPSNKAHLHPLRKCTVCPYASGRAKCDGCGAPCSLPYHCDNCPFFDYCDNCFTSTGSLLAASVPSIAAVGIPATTSSNPYTPNVLPISNISLTPTANQPGNGNQTPHGHPLKLEVVSPYSTTKPQCNNCHNYVVTAYHCGQCTNYDLCSKCYAMSGSKAGHAHMLTEYLVAPYESGTCKCNLCGQISKIAYHCYLCSDYDECPSCLAVSGSKVASPHPHVLTLALSTPYDGVPECDICRQLTSISYHCNQCKNYDECSACNFITQSLSKHPHDLTYYERFVYIGGAVFCDVCKKAIQDSYHCDTCGDYDECRDCFYKINHY